MADIKTALEMPQMIISSDADPVSIAIQVLGSDSAFVRIVLPGLKTADRPNSYYSGYYIAYSSRRSAYVICPDHLLPTGWRNRVNMRRCPRWEWGVRWLDDRGLGIFGDTGVEEEDFYTMVKDFAWERAESIMELALCLTHTFGNSETWWASSESGQGI